MFSRIASRLIMKKEWLTPKMHVAKIAQPRGSSCRISTYDGRDREQPEERVQETHVVEVEAAEQLSELAPADEEERGPVEIEAQPEWIDLRSRMCVGPCDVDERDLVPADLYRPAEEGQEVERRKRENQPDWSKHIDRARSAVGAGFCSRRRSRDPGIRSARRRASIGCSRSRGTSEATRGRPRRRSRKQPGTG